MEQRAILSDATIDPMQQPTVPVSLSVGYGVGWQIIEGEPGYDLHLDLKPRGNRIHRGPGRSELLRRFPRAVLPATITEDGWEHGGDDRYPDFYARCATVARRLEARFRPDDRVVVVGHGGCLNYVLHALLGIPLEAPVWLQMDLGAISTLRLVPGRERRCGWPLYPPVGVEVLSLNARPTRARSADGDGHRRPGGRKEMPGGR